MKYTHRETIAMYSHLLSVAEREQSQATPALSTASATGAFGWRSLRMTERLPMPLPKARGRRGPPGE
jgi:hypothetical protein